MTMPLPENSVLPATASARPDRKTLRAAELTAWIVGSRAAGLRHRDDRAFLGLRIPPRRAPLTARREHCSRVAGNRLRGHHHRHGASARAIDEEHAQCPVLEIADAAHRDAARGASRTIEE